MFAEIKGGHLTPRDPGTITALAIEALRIVVPVWQENSARVGSWRVAV
jgi:hypothetical protein